MFNMMMFSVITMYDYTIQAVAALIINEFIMNSSSSRRCLLRATLSQSPLRPRAAWDLGCASR